MQTLGRSEEEVFDDLSELCVSPGYAHVVAYFCFRDNVIGVSESLKAEDLLHMYSPDHLIRTEIVTLVGLMVKRELDLSIPSPETFQDLIGRTEVLLKELHGCLSTELAKLLTIEKSCDVDPFTAGSILREPIFYGGESAYIFQYRDLSIPKYQKDNDWLLQAKGFSIEDAHAAVSAICRIQDQLFTETLKGLRGIDPRQWTMLPAFTVTAAEIEGVSRLPVQRVARVLEAFSMQPDSRNNADFCSLGDYNAAIAQPIVDIGDGQYLVLQQYSLAEALYESPFYWMISDEQYLEEAMVHRGAFAERFAAERLRTVFGAGNVHSNVKILDASGQSLGEIDNLVLFGGRALVLQAKAKRLTLEAWRGNDRSIRADFKRSVQDAYDQGLSCAKLLQTQPCRVLSSTDQPIALDDELGEIYIICLVADHYPALSFQAKHFLHIETSASIPPPFVTDVFLLDVMAEMLDSPLRCLAYINRRTFYSNKVLANHELTVLSYHLKKNLWLDDSVDMVHLGDDLCADLDIAMYARREGLPGARTPDGILTRLVGTAVGTLVDTIETIDDPELVDLGFFLLAANEDTANEISNGIKEIAKRCRQDGLHHDFSVALREGSAGLTIHCNMLPEAAGAPKLRRHCERRKYLARANRWFGISIDPSTHRIRYGGKVEHDWAYSAEMEQATKQTVSSELRTSRPKRGEKTGRNDPCPCGSGRKFKKCCGR